MSKNAAVAALLLVGAAAAFFYFSKNQGRPASAQGAIVETARTKVPITNLAEAAEPGDMVMELADRTAVVSPTGIVKADAIYKGVARQSQAAQVYNILKREGENTPINLAVGGNPLITEYDKSIRITGDLPAGIRRDEMNLTQTFRSSRSPSNDAERNAARAANLKDLAARDPDYKNTTSYQKAAAELGIE